MMNRTDAQNPRSRPSAMNAPLTLRVALAIARRRLLSRALDWSQRGLALGAGIGVVLVLVARGLDAAPWALWAVIASAGLGVILGLAGALWHRTSLVAAAAAADAHAGLKDTLVSGLMLAMPGREHEDLGFSSLAIARAEGVAGGIRASQVVPIDPRRSWAIGPAVLALGVFLAFFVPPWGMGTASDRPQLALADSQAVTQTQQGIEDLARAIEAQRAGLDAGDATDAQSTERLDQQLERLREIEEELRAGRTDPQRAASDAASAATQAAETLEEQAERDLLADEALREALANLERQAEQDESAQSGESVRDAAERLNEALARGDLDRAAREAQDLLDRAQDPQASEQDRRAAAQRLREMAERLESAASPREPSAEPSSPAPFEQQEQDPAARDDQPQEPEAEQPEAGEQPPTPPTPEASDAPDPAPDEPAPDADATSETDPRERAHQQAREQQRELGEAMRRAADEVEGQQPEQEPQQGERGEGSPQEQTEPDGTSRESPDQPSQEPGQQEATEQGQRQPQGVTESPDRTQGEEGQPAQEGQEGQESQEIQDSQEGQGQSPKEQPGQGLAERLRQLADRPGRAQERKEQAQELRERAREAFDRMTPQEQRELLERLQQEQGQKGEEQGGLQDRDLGREPGEGAQDMPDSDPRQRESDTPGGRQAGEDTGTPGRSPRTGDPWEQELMDLASREQEARDEMMRTVAEWFGPGRETPGQGPSPADEARRAARGAQEAIERERVPQRRSELIRRVFERYAERLGREQSANDPTDGGSR